MDILLEVTFRKIKREREKKSEKESLSEDTQNFSYYNDNIMTFNTKNYLSLFCNFAGVSRLSFYIIYSKYYH